MKKASFSVAAALLMAAAATSVGAPPMIDGTRDAVYGNALWVNTTNPTDFGDNAPGFFPCTDFGSGMQLAINNSNVAGVPGAPITCVSSGAGVTTGIEIKIPFSAINNPTQATFTISGFIIGQFHDFISNQVIGGSTTCLMNLGDPRNVSFDDAAVGGVPGNQFVTVTNGTDSDPAGPTIDGTLDAALYGTPLWVNTAETGFGDANLGLAGQCNGSELDAVYARVLTVGGQKTLYIFLTGNLESNFNKVWVFLDCFDGQGQNRLRGDNVNLDFNGLNRLGDNSGMGTNGLQFDAGVAPDYALTCTNGNNGNPAMVTTFANIGELPTNGGGDGRFVGQAVNPNAIVVTPCVPTALPVPSPDRAYGSELDNAYGIVCGEYLYLHLGGNLEVNGNKLDLFFDVDSTTTNGGQNTLRADNVAVGFGGLNRMGAGNGGPGLTFDAGFNADYWVTFRNEGSQPTDTPNVGAEAAFLRTGGAAGDVTDAQGLLDYGAFTAGEKATNNPLSFNGTFCVRTVNLNGPDGAPDTGDEVSECAPNGSYTGTLPNVGPMPGSPWNPAPINVGVDVQGDLFGVANNLTPIAEIFTSYAPRLLSTNPFDPLGTQAPNPNLAVPGLIQLTIDNSNIAGVTSDAVAGAGDVTTGFELRIQLEELGWDGVSPIRVVAFVNGSSHDFVSNQVVGGLPSGTLNLGDPQAVNFDETTGGIAGAQYITVPVGNCDAVLTGACCCGSSCTITTAAACTGANRSFAGAGTSCTPFSNTVPCCRGDYNKSGAPATVQDIFDFLSGYFSNDACADSNDSGGNPTVQDIFDFLSAYFGGGC